METPLRKPNNIKEMIKSNYKRKILCLALSPLIQNQNKTRNNSLKPKKETNHSLSPQISEIQNSFFMVKNNQKMEKRNSTSTSISKIKLCNQYENMENIIYNKKFVQKGSYNILVAVRVRPLNQKEKMISSDETINVENKNTIILKDPSEYINPNNIRAKEQILTFDYAFDKNETQQNIFNSTTKFLINGIVNGFNATVFAYGATGAGKTYTMLGSDDNPGIMPYTLKELFNEIKLYPERDFKIKLWYLEIYNENIRDLLVNNNENLELREDPIKGLVVNGITEKETNSHEDILSLLKEGNKNRTTEETDANETSSRSHAILQILVSYKDIEKDKENSVVNNNIKCGKLSLIDLAGSERASMTGSKGMRLIEGGNINRSLLVLGNCINALCESTIKGNKPHIPYRDSKLTRLLKDSLGGNSRTVMIANVSPFVYNFDDTYNTLKYAERAKHIKTKIGKNILSYNSQYLRNNYLNVIRSLQGKISDLENRLLLYETNEKYLKIRNLSLSPPPIRKSESKIEEIIINTKKEEKKEDLNINIIKYNGRNDNDDEKGKNFDQINTIKENNIELEETSNINSYIEENDKVSSLIEDYIQQTQAEVKLKQKIMGIHYDIYLLNNIIKEKESKHLNIFEDKTKLKSYKKILEKNLSCFNEISKKNEVILLKYSNSKNLEDIDDQETKNTNNVIIENENESKDDEKIELNEYQKRFMILVGKMSKIQMENIEIKYNYALIKDEIDNKDKKLKNLEKQIELRDIIIKEIKTLDFSSNNKANNNANNEELNIKYKILLSDQQKTKYKTMTSSNLTEANIEKNNPIENSINNNESTSIVACKSQNKSKNKRKHFSFHPRNASFVKSNQIQTPNRRFSQLESSVVAQSCLNNNTEKEKNCFNFNFNCSELVTLENNKRFTINTTSHENENEIENERNSVGSKFNDIIKNFNIGTITSSNFSDKITIKKKNSEILIHENTQKNTQKNKNINKNDKNKDKDKDKDKEKEKDKNDESKDEDCGDDTNNKTLKSVLNDIKVMNSNINSKLNIIEKSKKNPSTTQIKPISRTMTNFENMNKILNNEISDYNKKKNTIKSTKKSNNAQNKKADNIVKKNITEKHNKSNSNLNLITAHTNIFRIEDNNISNNINFKNDLNSNDTPNPNIIISVNRNKKNKNKKKKMALISSISSNIQLNTINNNSQNDIKSYKATSPLNQGSSMINKGYSSSTTKTSNYSKMNKKYKTQRNNSLLSQTNIEKIDKDDLRKNLGSKRNKYKIKKLLKDEIKESQTLSNDNSLENIDEINSNVNIDKIINSAVNSKEKTKLQIFYSEQLNKQKNIKNNSPKNLKQKKVSSMNNTSKNSKSIINNNNDYDGSIVDMGTNHDTIDNRKKKSYICGNKNKEKDKEKDKEKNKHVNKKLTSTEKKKK